MERQTLTINFIDTICWDEDVIVDWSSGQKYSLEGKIGQAKWHYGFGDSAINSSNGEYVFIYNKLGTKGILLKNGELVREINRSYYCYSAYEFPVAFVSVKDRTYLIHCPIAYNQLDFEDVETGELVTNVNGRKPDDMFYSRLEVSPDGTYLMSKGWVWHPLDSVVLFNINDCLRDPQLLDTPQIYPDAIGTEICTASFVDDDTIIIGSSDEIVNDENIDKMPPKHICLWDLKTGQFSKPVKVKEDFGNLFAIDKDHAWDLFSFPKILNINTGEMIECNKDVKSGEQRSAIINATINHPSIIFNRKTKQIAIKGIEIIEVLTPHLIQDRAYNNNGIQGY